MEKQALLGVIPPIIATLIFILIAWRPWKKSAWPTGNWGSAFGIAIGYSISDLLLRGVHTEWRGILPVSGGNFHPHVALLTAIIVSLLSRYKKIGARMPSSIFLAAIACAAYLRTPLANDRDATIPIYLILTAICLAMWSCIRAASHLSKGARIPLVLWAAATGNALILLQSHNLALAQLSGALAASMGVFVLLGWLRPQLPAIHAAVPVYTLVMAGLLIAGRGFNTPWSRADRPFLFAALAVASPILTMLPPIRKLKPWLGTLIAIILTLTLCAVGLYLTDDGFDFSGFK